MPFDPGTGLAFEHAVGGNPRTLDHLRGQHGALRLVEDIHHLFETGHLGIDDVVGQEDREGLVAHQFARGEHGVAQAQRLFLAHIGDVDQVGNLADDLQQVGLAALLQHFFQFVADVEVVFDGLFAASGDDDDLIAAGRDRLFDAVLDDGLVHQRQHLFGLRLGGGQKPGAQTGSGKNGFANFFCHPDFLFAAWIHKSSG